MHTRRAALITQLRYEFQVVGLRRFVLIRDGHIREFPSEEALDAYLRDEAERAAKK